MSLGSRESFPTADAVKATFFDRKLVVSLDLEALNWSLLIVCRKRRTFGQKLGTFQCGLLSERSKVMELMSKAMSID